jgi:hypothetical protein
VRKQRRHTSRAHEHEHRERVGPQRTSSKHAAKPFAVRDLAAAAFGKI